MTTNQLHPLALEIVNRIHQGEPADQIAEDIRRDRNQTVGVLVAIHELAAAEHRLERIRAQAQQAEADAERLVARLNQAIQAADAARLLEARR